MSDTTFQWTIESLTPTRSRAVGNVVLHWAMVDEQVTGMIDLFWFDLHREAKRPTRFEDRVTCLLAFAAKLYAGEPNELRLLRWFVQRLRTLAGKRNAIAHGQFVKITKKGRTYDGLMIPGLSGSCRLIPITLEELLGLPGELQRMAAEAAFVRSALWAAFVASSPDKESWSDRQGVWTRLTWENRPLLPRWNRPPPTFA